MTQPGPQAEPGLAVGPTCPAPLERWPVPRRAAALIWPVIWRLLRWLPNGCNALRIACLHLCGARVSYSSFIDRRVRIQQPWNLSVGGHCHVAHGVILDCAAAVSIGEGTRISQYSHLCGATHDYTQRNMPLCRKPIVIGRNVWLAADVFVDSGVSIGDDTVVGARSSVCEDLPAGVVALGSPARVVRRLRPSAATSVTTQASVPPGSAS